MRTALRCFNGHVEPRPGCAGCHHAFHVLVPGSVSGGELIPPKVTGPLACALCHEALHATPVRGCELCAASYVETIALAMDASQEVRTEVIGLRVVHWLVGWHARIAGWVAIISGRAFTDLFSRPDGSTQWVTLLISMIAVPGIQWLIGTQIVRKEKQLPRLGANGEIVYGE